MSYAPVNPSDIYFSKGVYGIRKNLPTIIGFEGSGYLYDTQNDQLKPFIGKKCSCWVTEELDNPFGTWA